MHIHSPIRSSFDVTIATKNPSFNYDIGTIVTHSTIYHLKYHLCFCVCKITALGDVSRDEYSTHFHLVLYLSLNTHPLAVDFVYTCIGALSSLKNFAWLDQNKQNAGIIRAKRAYLTTYIRTNECSASCLEKFCV